MKILLGFVLVLAAAMPVIGNDLFIKSDVTAQHSISELSVVNFFAPEQPVVVARGRSDANVRMFSFYETGEDGAVNGEPRKMVSMPRDSLFFDFAPISHPEQQNLLFFDDVGVQVYNLQTGAVNQVIYTPSIYRQSVTPLFQQMDFARDLTGNGLADILIPDFQGYRLFLNDGKGGFPSEIRLNMQVEMRVGSTNPRFPGGTVPRYNEFPLYSADVNFDGLKDIVFLQDRSFVAFHQKDGGGFGREPQVYPIDIEVIGNSFAEQIRSNDRYADQSDLSETIIKTVEDINGDTVPDIVTETDNAQGLFNRSTVYRFHYGLKEHGGLAFRRDPDAVIKQDGITADTRHIDFTSDGRVDFAGGATNIGLMKIVGILLSGSASVQVSFYEQNDDGSFETKAKYRKKVSVDFDMSSGQSSVPVVEMTDLNGDGHKDLVLSKGQEKLRFYMATPNAKKMFAKKPTELALSLPKNGKFVSIQDVNGDARGDVLVHYDRLGMDGTASKKRFLVFTVK